MLECLAADGTERGYPIPVPRIFRSDRLIYLTVYVVLSLVFCWPFFVQPMANGLGDWDQHTFYYASVLRSAAAGQLPFWNPWYCGGNVLWQNPQVSLVSPMYLLALVMPLALAMKINVVAHYVVGCLGMHLLLRRVIGVTSPIIVVTLVALSAFSGGIALHLAAGHSNYLSVLWLPALVYCFFRAAAGSRRSVVLGGAIIGFAVLNAAPHLVPLAAVLLGSLGAVALVTTRSLKPLAVAALIVAAGCAFAAPKLVPAAAFARGSAFEDRRPVKHPDSMSVEMFRRALWDEFQKKTIKVTPGVQLYAWHEYGNYMGWFGAGLALAAAAWILFFRWRSGDWREVAAAASLVIMLLLAMGEFGSYAPASLLQRLPLFSSFRIPSRHILLAPLLGAACLAFVVRAFQDLPWSRDARRLVAIVCVLSVWQLVAVNRENLRHIFVLPPSAVEARALGEAAPIVAEHEPPDVTWSRLGENSMMLRSMAAGVSQLNCYEPLLARRIAQPGPAVIRAEAGVSLSDPMFSPNRVSAHAVVSGAAARVVLNQNFEDGWSSNAGIVERDPASGLPSVVLPAGYDGVVTFSFAPSGLMLGLGICALAIVLSIFIWRRSGDASPATQNAER